MNPINPNGLNQLKSESNSSVSPSDVCQLAIANLQVVSRTDTSTDYYRITDAHKAHSIFLFSLQNLKFLVCCTESHAVI